MRAYQASVDTLSDEPSLAATPSEASAELVISTTEPLLVVRRCTAPTARAAVNALRTAVRLRPLGRVSLPAPPAEGAASRFAPQSLFFLDVLANRLRIAGLSVPNLTVARFKVGDASVEGDDGETERRPTLRAVRFEGDHLLDSSAACKLLAEEGRALVDVAMHLSVPARGGRPASSFPVRVALDADHAVVMTGYGTQRPELSVGLQRTLVEAVTAEAHDGLADADRLERLCDRVLVRSRIEQPVARADVLDDPGDDEPGDDDPVL